MCTSVSFLHKCRGRAAKHRLDAGGERQASGRGTLLERLSSRFSFSNGMSRVSLGLSDALSRLGISCESAEAGPPQSISHLQAHLVAHKGTSSSLLAEDLKVLRRGA